MKSFVQYFYPKNQNIYKKICYRIYIRNINNFTKEHWEIDKVINIVSKSVLFFSVLIRIGISGFRCTVSDLSVFLKYFIYINEKY